MSDKIVVLMQANHVRSKEYMSRVREAYNFAGNDKANDWAGQFLIGLALAGLELIPFTADIRPRPYWLTAPEPPHDGNDWPISWIVEYGVLNQLGDDYGYE